jgi:membrane fusion protein (multidrug efflux system)
MIINTNKTNNHSILFILLLAFSVVLSGCGEADGGKKPGRGGPNSKRPVTQIPVSVAKPEVGLAASYYVTTATIEPSSDANINSRTSGVVKQLLREEGDDVKSGDVLLILDDDDQRLRLQQAEQKLASAKREYDRLNKMKKAGVVSPTEWEATENNYRTADTEQKLAQLALSYTRVAAPFDGRVVWRAVDLGEHVNQSELLFRMMSINPLLVRVHIPANRLGHVAVGQTVALNVDGVAQPLNAVIALVSPIVDPDTGTIKITLRLDEYPSSVRPGDFTEVHMVTNKHENALLVPSTALIEERGQYYLYVVEDGKAIRKEVTHGFVMTTQTEVVAGLSKEDDVVVKGQRSLKNDAPVEILDPNNKASKDKTARNEDKKKQGKGEGNRKGKRKKADQ